MKDPFPFGPGPLAELIRPLAKALNLTTLPEHIHEVILSTLLYHSIFVYASPWLSTRLFPHTYPRLPFRTRLNWDVHSVSLVQSIVIVVLYLLASTCAGRAHKLTETPDSDSCVPCGHVRYRMEGHGLQGARMGIYRSDWPGASTSDGILHVGPLHVHKICQHLRGGYAGSWSKRALRVLVRLRECLVRGALFGWKD